MVETSVNEGDDRRLIFVEFGGKAVPLSELIDGLSQWLGRLQREAAEHPLPAEGDDDVALRHLWNMFDYFGALHLREFVQRGVEQDVDGAYVAEVAAVDGLLRSITDPDELGFVVECELDGKETDEWWWHRIAKAGLPRVEIDGAIGRQANRGV